MILSWKNCIPDEKLPSPGRKRADNTYIIHFKTIWHNIKVVCYFWCAVTFRGKCYRQLPWLIVLPGPDTTRYVRHVGEADWLQRRSADVKIPHGDGGWEARSFMRLALGRWYLVLVCVVHQGFWQGWWVVVRNACSIGPNRARGSKVKVMRTMFFQYSLPMTSPPRMKGVEGMEGLCVCPSLPCSWY
jgi:hypothetical protein